MKTQIEDSPGAGTFSIFSDFPGGNILVQSIKEHIVHLAPDLRDTTTPWFYWYFGVRGAAGRHLTFVFDKEVVGVRGAAVSLDEGRTWKWMSANTVAEGEFSYDFPKDAKEVRFSLGMPYVGSNWTGFLKTLPAGSPWDVRTLATTPRGRDVPLLRAGDSNARHCVVMTGRHHACEMMASYVMEGVIQGLLQDSEPGRWLLENVEFLFVPFMDTDGVECGDQGKNRAPYDHNRDYRGTPLYAEVKLLFSETRMIHGR